MAFGLSKSRISPIAIDFGADSLKLLQIVPSDPPQIVAAARMEVPEHARTDPSARTAFFMEALKMALKSQGFKGKRAICAIPGYQTLVQHFQIARVEHEELDAQIGIHLRQRLNVNPSRMVIRTLQVGNVVRDGTTKQEVICMAASKEAVMRHIETAHRAKLDVVGMHVEPYSIVGAFGHLFRRGGEEARTTCFVDIGAATTKVCIAHGEKLVFAQTIHAAGDQLTRAMAHAEGISFSEARERRHYNAVNGSGSSVGRSSASTQAVAAEPQAGGAATLVSALEAQIDAELTGEPAKNMRGEKPLDPADDPLECLIDELQLCARYHQSVFADRPIEKLVFLGGESTNVSICQRIAKALRIGAQLGDPLARAVNGDAHKRGTGVDLRQPQPGWAVPFGLCLSETND